MPIHDFLSHFRMDMPFFINKVGTFVEIDNDMEKTVYSDIFLANSRYHRNTEQIAQQAVIKGITAGFQFIVHIEGYYHAYIHIDKLGSKIEITLQVGRIDHINDHIRRFINDVAADINFFGSIS